MERWRQIWENINNFTRLVIANGVLYIVKQGCCLLFLALTYYSSQGDYHSRYLAFFTFAGAFVFDSVFLAKESFDSNDNFLFVAAFWCLVSSAICFYFAYLAFTNSGVTSNLIHLAIGAVCLTPLVETIGKCYDKKI